MGHDAAQRFFRSRYETCAPGEFPGADGLVAVNRSAFRAAVFRSRHRSTAPPSRPSSASGLLVLPLVMGGHGASIDHAQTCTPPHLETAVRDCHRVVSASHLGHYHGVEDRWWRYHRPDAPTLLVALVLSTGLDSSGLEARKRSWLTMRRVTMALSPPPASLLAWKGNGDYAMAGPGGNPRFAVAPCRGLLGLKFTETLASARRQESVASGSRQRHPATAVVRDIPDWVGVVPMPDCCV